MQSSQYESYPTMQGVMEKAAATKTVRPSERIHGMRAEEDGEKKNWGKYVKNVLRTKHKIDQANKEGNCDDGKSKKEAKMQRKNSRRYTLLKEFKGDRRKERSGERIEHAPPRNQTKYSIKIVKKEERAAEMVGRPWAEGSVCARAARDEEPSEHEPTQKFYRFNFDSRFDV